MSSQFTVRDTARRWSIVFFRAFSSECAFLLGFEYALLPLLAPNPSDRGEPPPLRSMVAPHCVWYMLDQFLDDNRLARLDRFLLMGGWSPTNVGTPNLLCDVYFGSAIKAE